MWGWPELMVAPWNWIGGIFGIIFFVVLIALLIWGVTKLAQRDSSSGGEQRKSPLDIAKERYARGEINKEEFDTIKKDLA